jgi:hypothetical protein
MSYFNCLTDQERFNLHQAGIDQVIIDELDKDNIQYSHEYIQELVRGTLIYKKLYDKKTRWIELNIINEREPIFLDLDELKIKSKKQLIGYCNNIQFAKMKHGISDYYGDFDYTHTSNDRVLQKILYSGQDILNNNILDDLTFPKTFKIDALKLDVILQNV